MASVLGSHTEIWHYPLGLVSSVPPPHRVLSQQPHSSRHHTHPSRCQPPLQPCHSLASNQGTRRPTMSSHHWVRFLNRVWHLSLGLGFTLSVLGSVHRLTFGFIPSALDSPPQFWAHPSVGQACLMDLGLCLKASLGRVSGGEVVFTVDAPRDELPVQQRSERRKCPSCPATV